MITSHVVKTIGDFELRLYVNRPSAVLYSRSLESHIDVWPNATICNWSHRLFEYED